MIKPLRAVRTGFWLLAAAAGFALSLLAALPFVWHEFQARIDEHGWPANADGHTPFERAMADSSALLRFDAWLFAGIVVVTAALAFAVRRPWPWARVTTWCATAAQGLFVSVSGHRPGPRTPCQSELR